MSTLTNYIVKGLAAGILGIAVGEVAITAITAAKARKDYLKALKEDPEVSEEHYKDCKSGKKAKKLVLECIKEAAKVRVESIKKDPIAEMAALWGVVTFLIGNWKGYFRGFEKGWSYGNEDVNRLLQHFKDKYPVELTNLVKRALDDKDEVTLSEWSHGDILHRGMWIAEKCDLPKIKEVLS